MKILFIAQEIPYPEYKNALSQMDYRLLKNAPRYIKIDLLIDKKGKNDDERMFRIAFPSVKDIYYVSKNTPNLKKRINLVFVYFFGSVIMRNRCQKDMIQILLSKNAYDMVYAMSLIKAFDFYRIKNAPPIFLNAVDSLSLLCKSFYNKEKSITNLVKIELYREFEKKMLKNISCINFVSSVDAEYIYNLTGHQNIINITLGVDENRFFQNKNIKKESGALIFSGNYSYKPNLDTAKYIVKELFPKINEKYPYTKLYIVGKNPIGLKSGKNVILTDYVESIPNWYNKSEIFLCPLLSGSGIKNKILEAMACGLPVISSSIGVSGIHGLINGVHFILADSKDEQIASVGMILSNSKLKENLALNAIKFIKENYSLEKSVSAYYDAFNKLINV